MHLSSKNVPLQTIDKVTSVAENKDTGEDALIALAGPANKQGRIAADNICGGGFRFYDAVMNDRALIERAAACGADQ